MSTPTIIAQMCEYAKSQDGAGLHQLILQHPNSVGNAIEQLAEAGDVTAVNFSMQYARISWHCAIAGYARGGHLQQVETIITHCAQQEWGQRDSSLRSIYLTTRDLVDYGNNLASRIENSRLQISRMRADQYTASQHNRGFYIPYYSYIANEEANLSEYQKQLAALRPLIDTHVARLDTAANNLARAGNVAAVEDFYQRGAHLGNIIIGFNHSKCFTDNESALFTLTQLNNAVLITNLVESFQPQLNMLALLRQAQQMKKWMQEKKFTYKQARAWCHPELQTLFLQVQPTQATKAIIKFAAHTYSLTDLEAEDLYTKAQLARAVDKQAALQHMTANAIAELNKYISSRVKNETSLELTVTSKVFRNHDLTRAKVSLAVEFKTKLLTSSLSAAEVQKEVKEFKVKNKLLELGTNKSYRFFGHSHLTEKLEIIEPMVKRQLTAK